MGCDCSQPIGGAIIDICTIGYEGSFFLPHLKYRSESCRDFCWSETDVRCRGRDLSIRQILPKLYLDMSHLEPTDIPLHCFHSHCLPK